LISKKCAKWIDGLVMNAMKVRKLKVGGAPQGRGNVV